MHCVALTRRGLRVRKVFTKLSPGEHCSARLEIFQQFARKKDVIVFVDFRKGYESLFFLLGLPVRCSEGEAGWSGDASYVERVSIEA
jgi:hypothetical protein